MATGLKARGDDGIHAGIPKYCSLVGCCRRANREDAFPRHSSRISLGGTPQMKLNAGTLASSNTRA